MRRIYDIFERFTDGSSLWRGTVPGRYEAQRRMQEFAEHSENTFFAIDIQAGQPLTFELPYPSARRIPRARAANA
jgi:hypothetical protein